MSILPRLNAFLSLPRPRPRVAALKISRPSLPATSWRIFANSTGAAGRWR